MWTNQKIDFFFANRIGDTISDGMYLCDQSEKKRIFLLIEYVYVNQSDDRRDIYTNRIQFSNLWNVIICVNQTEEDIFLATGDNFFLKESNYVYLGNLVASIQNIEKIFSHTMGYKLSIGKWINI